MTWHRSCPSLSSCTSNPSPQSPSCTVLGTWTAERNLCTCRVTEMSQPSPSFDFHGCQTSQSPPNLLMIPRPPLGLVVKAPFPSEWHGMTLHSLAARSISCVTSLKFTCSYRWKQGVMGDVRGREGGRPPAEEDTRFEKDCVVHDVFCT